MALTRPPPDELITVQDAADLLKVHYMTAYRWVRSGDLPAFKTGGRLRIRMADLERFLADRQLDVATDRRDGGTDWDTHVDRLVDTLVAGDDTAAIAAVRRIIADGATAGEVHVSLLAPALHRIGTAWAAGEINVAVEHRASAICAAIVAQLSDMFRRRRPHRGTAVTLTPPQEQHALAAAIVADFLRAAGFDVHHLGADVPVTDLEVFLRFVPADVVCFSVTRPLSASTYDDLVAACQGDGDGSRNDTTVVFGGQGVDDRLAERAGGLTLDDVHRLAEVLDGQ